MLIRAVSLLLWFGSGIWLRRDHHSRASCFFIVVVLVSAGHHLVVVLVGDEYGVGDVGLA